MRKLFVVSLVLGLGLMLSACASAPTAEINACKAAVAAARTDDVQTYAPDSLKAAEDELSKALAEIQTQDAKFALSRDYKQSTEALKSAVSLAEKAANDAKINKEKAKADAQATITALPQLLDEAKKTLAKAPKGKDTKADLEAMQNDLKIAEESLNEANTAMTQEKYLEAVTKANSAKEKASAVVEQVKTALEKVKGRR
jgi:hypothetical protein